MGKYVVEQPRPDHDAIDLIAKWEGFRANAYICPAGWPTIGYGSTRWFNKPGQPKVQLGQTITRDDALTLLEMSVDMFWDSIVGMIHVPLNQNQVNAIVSFVYNIGAANFKTSTFLRMLNNGDFDGASNQLLRWNRGTVGGVKKVLPGLTNRRKDEKALFDMPMPETTHVKMAEPFHQPFQNNYNYGRY